MKVDRSNVKDIIDEHNDIVEQLNFINSYIPWDLPPNVQKCREIRYKRLKKKLEFLVTTSEAIEHGLEVDYFNY